MLLWVSPALITTAPSTPPAAMPPPLPYADAAHEPDQNDTASTLLRLIDEVRRLEARLSSFDARMAVRGRVVQMRQVAR